MIYHHHMINCFSCHFFLDCYDTVLVQARRPTKAGHTDDCGSDFAAWKVQWDSHLSLPGLDNEDAAKQVQTLTLCFTQETLTIVENLGLSEDKQKSVATIIAAIKCYIEGYINESIERRNFRQRIQQPGETFDDFLVSL